MYGEAFYRIQWFSIHLWVKLFLFSNLRIISDINGKFHIDISHFSRIKKFTSAHIKWRCFGVSAEWFFHTKHFLIIPQNWDFGWKFFDNHRNIQFLLNKMTKCPFTLTHCILLHSHLAIVPRASIVSCEKIENAAFLWVLKITMKIWISSEFSFCIVK